MTERGRLADRFLSRTDWAGCARDPLAGDASNRRYERLTGPGGTRAVLMDAPPGRGEDVRPFVRIAGLLRGWGLSAPRILAQDAAQGFLLLEDLGDDLFARVIAADAAREAPLYEAATDLLLHLHRHPAPDLARLTPPVLAEMTRIAFDCYGAALAGPPPEAAIDALVARLGRIFAGTIGGDPVLILRDYHAENLLWLPERDGVARVGLLDFQDAVTGHAAYDLVSLLQDARRDIPAAIERSCIDRYVRGAGGDAAGFRTAYALLGVQRSLRILGVFARLARDHGKTRYLAFMPRVHGHVMHGLRHEALAPVRDDLAALLPEPTPANLDRLKPR
ncbi:aminoglycoside phosphotransferase family protein [Pukyongiella litopenaei]|uniref:Phosphotransferase n=1 Tax=Pukyongiella litopenaei TaxID=2605946 RepID=A0A2S0MSB2_9RHOB|nr:phosphotransferase [Pukyongiella litopenaei]AVO38770.1 phosphotransferase [Pukyongiella litopenaei]